MKTTFIKNLAIGLGITLVFFILIELILMAAGVKPLYERSDPSVGFSGYAPLFLKQTQTDGAEVFKTAPNKIKWFNMQSFPAQKAVPKFQSVESYTLLLPEGSVGYSCLE